MTATVEKRTFGAEDLEGEGSNSLGVEDLAGNKKLKVEDNSIAEESQVPEGKRCNPPPEMAQNKKLKIEEHEEDEEDDEEWVRRYCQQVKDSEGFVDIVGPPPFYLCGAISDIGLEDLKDPSIRDKYYTPIATEAIKHHIMQQGENLELVDIVKVNAQVVCGIRYYLTLRAKDDSGETKTYQAKVESLGSSLKFPMFRLKPDKNVAGQGN